jgi:hypothetical protein
LSASPPPRSVTKAVQQRIDALEGGLKSNLARISRKQGAANQKLVQQLTKARVSRDVLIDTLKKQGEQQAAAKAAFIKKTKDQINQLRQEFFAQETAKFNKVLADRAAAARRTSKQQAQAVALKQSEIRAVAAAQGVAVGTIEKGAAGTGGIANITTPTGEQKKVVLPTTSSDLAQTPIEKLPEPTKAGGRALQVELQETLKIGDAVDVDKVTATEKGGIAKEVTLTERLGLSDVKPIQPPKEVDKITKAFQEQAEQKAAAIPQEDIEGTDFAIDIATGEITEKIRLTEEAKAKQQQAFSGPVAAGQLTFTDPTALALGQASQVVVPETQVAGEKQKKELVLEAGEKPTAEQLKDVTSIVQKGTGQPIAADLTKPVTTFFDNISKQIDTFTQEQENIAKTSDNIIEKGLASISAGAGKVSGEIVKGVGSGLSGIEQGEVKKTLETTQDNLFNIVTVQKQIAEQSGNPIERGLANVASFGAEASRQLVGDVAFGLNISEQLRREGLRSSIREGGQFDFIRAISTPLPTEQEIRVPETLANVAIGEGAVGLIEARGFATSQDPLANLSKAFGPAGAKIGEIIESRGIAAGLGSLVAIALPFNPKAAVPFRIAKVAQTTGRITRTLEPIRISTAQSPVRKILGKRISGGEIGIREVQTPEITELGSQLVFGFGKAGGKRPIPLLARTAETGITAGSLAKQGKAVERFVAEASPIGRGFELATEQPIASKILTSEQVLTAKVKAGKLLESQRELPKVARELAQLIAKTPESKQQTFVKATEQLTEAVQAGKESEALAKLLAKLPASKGGFGQSFLVIGERARKDIDIDFAGLFRGEKKAEKKAIEAQQELTIAARGDPSRKFTVKFTEGGPKLQSSGGKLGEQEKKVIEFLTKRDSTDAGQLDSLNKDLNQVFGQKVQRGTTEIQLPFEQAAKVDKLQGQAFKKIASALSEKGPKVEGAGEITDLPFLKAGAKLKTTKEGFRIGPPSFRLKDVVDIAGEGQIVETLAATSRQAGKTKLADELITLNERFKKNFPEIDFKAVSKQADTIEFGNVGKSEVGSAAALKQVGGEIATAIKPASASLTAQTSKGLISAKADSVGVNIKKNVDISISSPAAKRTLDSIGTITSSKPSATTSKSLSKALDELGSIVQQPKKAGTIESSLASISSIGKQGSLIRNLDSLASLPASKPTDTSLGLPSPPSQPSPISIPNISTASIPFLDEISVKSPPSKPSEPSPIKTSVPSLSPPSTPSTPSPAVPKIPRGASPAGLVFGKSTRTKPPFVARPPFLINIDDLEGGKKKRLPTFTKALTFIADPADPLRAGVFAAKGVGQLVSGKATVFKTIDRKLKAARQAKGAFVPLGENIGIERARIGLGPPKKRKSKKRKR